MHESDPGLVCPGVVEVVEDGDQHLQHVGALQNKEQELLVVVAQLPEQDQKLLVEVNLNRTGSTAPGGSKPKQNRINSFWWK